MAVLLFFHADADRMTLDYMRMDWVPF